MLPSKDFIQMSLELNLFFGRIMKEHMIFIEAGLPIKNSSYILEADQIKKSFEELLMETISLANGAISQEAIDSNEFVTPFTLEAETKVENLTGICINKDITLAELKLSCNPDFNFSPSLERYVFDLNNRYINLIVEIIEYMEKILSQFLDCSLFIFLYPNMLDHLIREAKFYLKNLLDLQERTMSKKNILKKQVFWDEIMGEHAQYIRGMLDPTEKTLFEQANDFAILFERLLEETKEAEWKNVCEITRKNLKGTEGLQEFKTSGVEGILACQIKSIINPLLADHVLREANRYIRVLKAYLEKC